MSLTINHLVIIDGEERGCSAPGRCRRCTRWSKTCTPSPPASACRAVPRDPDLSEIGQQPSDRILHPSILYPALIAQSPEAERLFADRANLASARRAAEIWSSALAGDPRNFDAAWRLARADYWLGGHGPEAERRGYFDTGIEAGRKAAGAAAETGPRDISGWRRTWAGSPSRSACARAEIPQADQGDAGNRAAPRIPRSARAPPIARSGGGTSRCRASSAAIASLAESHLRTSLSYNPASTVSALLLGELLDDEGRKDEARAEWQRVLDVAAQRPTGRPKDREFKDKAKRALGK